MKMCPAEVPDICFKRYWSRKRHFTPWMPNHWLFQQKITAEAMAPMVNI